MSLDLHPEDAQKEVPEEGFPEVFSTHKQVGMFSEMRLMGGNEEFLALEDPEIAKRGCVDFDKVCKAFRVYLDLCRNCVEIVSPPDWSGEVNEEKTVTEVRETFSHGVYVMRGVPYQPTDEFEDIVSGTFDETAMYLGSGGCCYDSNNSLSLGDALMKASLRSVLVEEGEVYVPYLSIAGWWAVTSSTAGVMNLC